MHDFLEMFFRSRYFAQLHRHTNERPARKDSGDPMPPLNDPPY